MSTQTEFYSVEVVIPKTEESMAAIAAFEENREKANAIFKKWLLERFLSDLYRCEKKD